MSNYAVAFEVCAGSIYQNLPNNAWTVITNISNVLLDTNNGWVANDHGYRVPVAGKYFIQGEIWHETKNSGDIEGGLFVNNNLMREGEVITLTIDHAIMVFGVFNLAANDLVQLGAHIGNAPSSVGVAWGVTKLAGFFVGL